MSVVRARCLSPLLFLLPGLMVSASAQETWVDPREQADRLCASYGPGFVAGHAPGQCVKVEQRLRVEPNAPRPASGVVPPSAFAPMSDQPAKPQLRINGGFGAASAAQP